MAGLSLVPSPLHARRVWSKGSHFLVLEVRILQPNQVWLWHLWNVIMCSPYVRACTWPYAHGTEVVVSFYFIYTGIVDYCIPARCVSAILWPDPFWVGGASPREKAGPIIKLYTEVSMANSRAILHPLHQGTHLTEHSHIKPWQLSHWSYPQQNQVIAVEQRTDSTINMLHKRATALPCAMILPILYWFYSLMSRPSHVFQHCMRKYWKTWADGLDMRLPINFAQGVK